MMGIKSFQLKNLNAPVSIIPLVHFRILFGLLMFVSLLRFWLNGWIETQYIQPSVHFTFFGFEWVQYPGDTLIYVFFAAMMVASLGILFGFLYRFFTIVFFVLFSYVELIDATNYLNHYYFVSLIAFLLMLVPAHKKASLDVKFAWVKPTNHVAWWQVQIFKFQLFVVYFYAGLAKLNSEWMIQAQPLSIWLSAKTHLPIIGELLGKTWAHYAFSWFGAIYDLCIPFLLLNKRTVKLAFVFVVVFHAMTAMLFQIGMFPYIMIMATTIFFTEKWHLQFFKRWHKKEITDLIEVIPVPFNRTMKVVLTTYIVLQLLIPFRYVLYPGNLFWTEQGYRFSWRVMLMEKAGYATFYVKDAGDDRSLPIRNLDYLNAYQEKMMATQPDLIWQFAQIIAQDYRKKGMKKPEIYVESYVTINGRTSYPFIDFNVNLLAEKNDWIHKKWILPSNL
jgi:hypothetical protein